VVGREEKNEMLLGLILPVDGDGSQLTRLLYIERVEKIYYIYIG
jgi:hypothetical protein